jgi:hypothetical protein
MMAGRATMDAGKASLVLLIHRYLGGLMDPFVTLLELHKLMYFMQEAGEPLRRRARPGEARYFAWGCFRYFSPSPA